MNKTKVAIVLLAANLVVTTYYGYTIKKEQQRTRELTEQRMQNMQNSIANLNYQIINGVMNELQSQSEKISATEYKIKEVSFPQKTAVVDLSITLKEVAPSAQLLVVYKTDNGQVQEAPLTVQSSLSYKAELKLQSDQNYFYNIIERVGDGERQLNASEQLLPLYNDLYGSRVYVTSTGRSIDSERMRMEYSFTVKDLGIQGTSFKSAELRVLYDNELVEELDITSEVELQDGDYAYLRDKYNVAKASGEIGEDVSLEQYGREHGEGPSKNDGEQNYTYTRTIVFKNDYPELKLNRENMDRLSFQLIVECEDGFIFKQ
ncbi:hypothetical protein [Paenibacillus sp. GXUN7292]|uniref:hypothetical protein n=1 Tax=Paenibacillus sp. GXUN7292 TaxID=3422499 RepID=UPI003D7CE90C